MVGSHLQEDAKSKLILGMMWFVLNGLTDVLSFLETGEHYRPMPFLGTGSSLGA